MRKLGKALTAALVAGSALTIAIPAQAQWYPQQQQRGGWDDRDDDRYEDRRGDRDRRYEGDGRRGYDRQDYGRVQAIRAQIDQLRYRVERIDRRDRISEREAAALRRAVYELRLQFRDFSRDGLSNREARFLQDRINRVRDRLHYERQDRDGRRW
jgi:predicted RNase H-like nuclease (RuvC/YqgF family)